jgi:hypothetical protein
MCPIPLALCRTSPNISYRITQTQTVQGFRKGFPRFDLPPHFCIIDIEQLILGGRNALPR